MHTVKHKTIKITNSFLENTIIIVGSILFDEIILTAGNDIRKGN